MTHSNNSCSQEFVGKTARFWSERTGEQVSLDDAREMIQNVSRFFGILKKWQQQEVDKSKPNEGNTERKRNDGRIFGFEDNATMPKV